MERVIWLVVILSSGTGQQLEGNEGNEGKDAGECEEAWHYRDFLKMEVTQVVDRVLQETLYEAKARQVTSGQEGLEMTLEIAMRQVMEVRESVLGRIRAIRRGEGGTLTQCPGQGVRQQEQLGELRREVMAILLKMVDNSPASQGKIKEISQQLLKLKLSVQNEVMRLLLLPQPGSLPSSPLTPGGCSQCQGLQDLHFQLESLQQCAAQEDQEEQEEPPYDEPIEDIDLPQNNKPVLRPSGRASSPCPLPALYTTQLIAANDRVDSEIKSIYNQLVIETEEEARSERVASLEFYKTVRARVEEVISQLMSQKDSSRLKKLVSRGLDRIVRSLDGSVRSCLSSCGGSSCTSCAGQLLQAGQIKMEEYRAMLEEGDDKGAREFLREDLIQYIQENNQDSRDILIRKATDMELDECDQQKLEVYGVTKGPYWMLVNSTIFSSTLGEVGVMVSTMQEVLGMQFKKYCDSDFSSAQALGDDGPSCKWDEYEATKQYLEKLDTIIQDSLFKGGQEGDRMTALLGLVDLQGGLEGRVKRLFEERLVCPEEVVVVKEQYMPGLTRCMAEMMNPRLQFSRLTRRERLGCSKDLRSQMESRLSKLLREEVEESLEPEVPDFLEADSPIEDIDIGTPGGVTRPEGARSGGGRSAVQRIICQEREKVLRAADFLCQDGKTLLSISRVCDGVSDCPMVETSGGGEDEEGCQGSHTFCQGEQF